MEAILNEPASRSRPRDHGATGRVPAMQYRKVFWILAFFMYLVSMGFAHGEGESEAGAFGVSPDIEFTQNCNCFDSEWNFGELDTTDNTFEKTEVGSGRSRGYVHGTNIGHTAFAEGFAHQCTWGSVEVAQEHQVQCDWEGDYITDNDECTGVLERMEVKRQANGSARQAGEDAVGAAIVSVHTEIRTNCASRKVWEKHALTGIADANTTGEDYCINASLDLPGSGLEFPICIDKSHHSYKKFNKADKHRVEDVDANSVDLEILNTYVHEVFADGSWLECAAIRTKSETKVSATGNFTDKEGPCDDEGAGGDPDWGGGSGR